MKKKICTFCSHLTTIRASCKIGGILCCHISEGSMTKITVSCNIRGYHAYKEVSSPSIGEDSISFTEEENIHNRKAVAVTCAEG